MVDKIFSIKKALLTGYTLLSRGEDYRLEAEILLAHVLKVPRIYLYTHQSQLLSKKEMASFQDVLARRCRGEPIAYLLGYKEFWSLELAVDSNTLIPRPDTEVLVQLALDKLPKSALSIADLGVGSGAVAIALALERPYWQILATDISPKALRVAKQNLKKYNITNVKLLQSNWCQRLPINDLDAIVSNPPYIAENDPHLEGLRFEPVTALVSGRDGLDAFKKIIQQAKHFLKPGGLLLLEHGYNQATKVSHLMECEHYTQIESHRDFNHILRVTSGYTHKRRDLTV
jgi:release factor glutamine methyltransferase